MGGRGGGVDSHASDTKKIWHSLTLKVCCVHSDPYPRMQYIFFINWCDKEFLPPQKVSKANVSNRDSHDGKFIQLSW